MTDKIKSAISEIENMRKFNYTLAPNEVFDLAIRSLKSWEEVIEELEAKQKSTHDYALDVEDDLCLGKARGFARAIDIINQHLAEIEE